MYSLSTSGRSSLSTLHNLRGKSRQFDIQNEGLRETHLYINVMVVHELRGHFVFKTLVSEDVTPLCCTRDGQHAGPIESRREVDVQ